jgi:hypothetical protein
MGNYMMPSLQPARHPKVIASASELPVKECRDTTKHDIVEYPSVPSSYYVVQISAQSCQSRASNQRSRLELSVS